MPGVGIGVIILNEENKVLLILRNDNAEKADSDMRLEGTWTLPAGKVKKWETLFDAAKRKVKSEVNLDVSEFTLVSIAEDINEFDHFETFGILAKKYEGIVDLGNTEEHVSFDWFSLDELPENLCDPSRKIITNYLENIIYRGEENGKRKVLYINSNSVHI